MSTRFFLVLALGAIAVAVLLAASRMPSNRAHVAVIAALLFVGLTFVAVGDGSGALVDILDSGFPIVAVVRQGS